MSVIDINSGSGKRCGKNAGTKPANDAKNGAATEGARADVDAMNDTKKAPDEYRGLLFLAN